MLGAAAGEATGGGSPPSGPPTNASVYNAGSEDTPEDGVQWTNGDATASTAIGHSTSNTVEPTSNFFVASPGVTSYETGTAVASRRWWVKHIKNAQSSVWVLAGTGFG